jgi:hypothetical protein
MSKRFLMTRFLGLSEAEMAENERMWAEEQGDVDAAPADPAGLRSVGVSPGSIQGDMETLAPPAEGAEGAGPVPDLGAASPIAGAPGAPAPAI